MVNARPLPLFPREIEPVPVVQQAGWAPGPVRRGAENLVPEPSNTEGEAVLIMTSCAVRLSFMFLNVAYSDDG